MRTHGAKQQREAVKRAPKGQLDPVFEVGTFLMFVHLYPSHGPKLIVLEIIPVLYCA